MNNIRQTNIKTILYAFIFSIVLMAICSPSAVWLAGNAKLDFSWELSLRMAFSQGLLWGKDYLFTYGPLGFLLTPIYYSQHIWSIEVVFQFLIRWLYYFSLIYVISAFCLKQKKHFLIALIAASVGFISVQHIQIELLTYLTAIFLFISFFFVRREVARIFILALTFFLLALDSLIKSTILITIVPTFFLLPWIFYREFLSYRIAGKYTLFSILIYAVSYLVLWKLAGQTLGNLIPFLKGTFEIASGYNAVMMAHGLKIQIDIAYIILLSLIFLFFTLFKQQKSFTYTLLLFISFFIFSLWKEGFVRHDWSHRGTHAIAFFMPMFVLFCVLFASAFYDDSSKKIKWIFGICILLCSVIIIGLGYAIASPREYFSTVAQLILFPQMQRDYQNKLDEQIRAAHPMSAKILANLTNYSVSSMPVDISILRGYHLQGVLNPVPQAYSTYTPYLDHLNATQIQQSGAQRILYQFSEITDERYPPFDQPETLYQIISNYRPLAIDKDYLVLGRNSINNTNQLNCGISQNHSFNEWISLPNEKRLFAKINMNFSVMGKLTEALYKPPKINIIFKLADGTTKGPYRFIWPTAKDGVLISDFMDTNNMLAEFMLGHANNTHKIRAFMISNPHPRQYTKTFALSLCLENKHG